MSVLTKDLKKIFKNVNQIRFQTQINIDYFSKNSQKIVVLPTAACWKLLIIQNSNFQLQIPRVFFGAQIAIKSYKKWSISNRLINS